MIKISLPQRITSNDVVSLCRALGQAAHSSDEITVDFRHITYFELTPMSLLLGTTLGWCNDGKIVRFKVDQNCRVYPYMQRMDFFNLCGLSPPESFDRKPAKGRFREFAAVRTESEANRISTEIADCVVPWQADLEVPEKAQCHQCVEYCISELLLNAVQHSFSKGYVGCQYYPSKGSIQIAIADHGRGIRESFVGTPIEVACDVEAIQQAVEPMVTRNRGLPGLPSANRGVGLAILRQMAQRSNGKFTLISGEAAFDNNACCQIGVGCRYRGTFAAFEINRGLGADFDAILEEAKSYTDQFDGLDLEDMFE